MNRNIFSISPQSQFEIHQISSTGKIRESPTSSILKTPTAIFVTTRSSSAKTKRLTFANGPVDLQTLKNGTREFSGSCNPGVETTGNEKLNNDLNFEENTVEIAISPIKTMKVSPESWKAFLEYKKYNDYSNDTEKTDYTYSRLSKFRHKEIIPGFLIRPNLSRLAISSRRSSFSLPSSQTSFKESPQSKNYNFKEFNHSDSEIFSDLKMSNQSYKLGRSKYYLRSADFDWKETHKDNSIARSYLETEYYGHSPSENFTKTYAYSTTEVPESTTHYYGQVRSMELDDSDIDEVDDNPVCSENHYCISSCSNIGRKLKISERPPTIFGYFKNFFIAVFLYTTLVATTTRDLFSKYVLRRQDDSDTLPSALHDWRSEIYARTPNSIPWTPCEGKKSYSTMSYYSDGYYGPSRSWPQRISYYLYDSFSNFKNLIWRNTLGYTSSGQKKFWWFFIPLLLLAGSFLGYIDFFSNPKAILNTMFNWVYFIPSFLHYTSMVFIPSLMFKTIPYLILQAIPNFITITLPYFLMKTVPFYFWEIALFFADLSLANMYNMFVGVFMYILNFVTVAGESFYSIALNLISIAYIFSSKYLMLFYSNFCMQVFYLFAVLYDFALYFVNFVYRAFTFVMNIFK